MAQILKDEIREKIRKSGIEVFTENGYKKSSIKHIAEVAGVSVGNVYRYFKNKEDLYDDVIQGVYDGMEKLILAVEESGQYQMRPSIQMLHEEGGKIMEPLQAFINLYLEEKDVFTMLLNGEKDDHYDRTVRRYIELLKKHFYSMWGKDNMEGGLTKAEVTALTNALVFGAIGLLEEVEENQVPRLLTSFISDLMKGYFYVRQYREAKQ